MLFETRNLEVLPIISRFCLFAPCVLIIVFSGIPAPSTAQTTNTVPSRGAILQPEMSPTTGTTRTVPKTEVELREELRAALRTKNLRTYEMNVENMPPQLPGTVDSTTSETTLPDNETSQPFKPARSLKDAVVPPVGSPIGGNAFIEEGPGPIDNGQSENTTPSNQAVGAAHTVVCHPTDANTIYVGFVNGGIWKTTNAGSNPPVWSAQTDGVGSFSIGALEFDPADTSNQTLVAGIGRFSSLGRFGGNRLGLLRTTNGGEDWSIINGSGVMIGKNIAGVAARGAVIVAAVDLADNFTFSNIGIFRSTNFGASFSQISSTNGLPGGRAFDLASDPINPAILYTAIRDATTLNGIYKSTDTGLNWTRVSNAAINGLILDSSSPTPTSNVHIAVGNANNVYAAIANSGRLVGVFRSGDGGAIWTQMALPQTNEGGTLHGIHVGGQASIHFSLVADPNNANVVYIGGDRQPGNGDTGASFPNSIGADNYSGRLFRGNASFAFGSQWQHLTHSNAMGAAGGGTASNSAPHADSRDMAFDINGNIIQGDDGGVYRRTAPQNNTGNWFSLQGGLKTTEIHDIAYDSVSNTIIIGNQDNGTATQRTNGTWNTVSSGDGGDVAVDDTSLAASNQSIRYTSFQNLAGLRRRTFNSSGNQIANSACTLTVLLGSAIVPQFYTPIRVNPIVPSRLVIGAQNGIYESLDSGNTVSAVGPGIWAGDGLSGVGIDVGGRQGGVDNPNVIYAVDGAVAHVRTTAGGGFANATIATGGDNLLDVSMDSNNFAIAYCVDKDQVFRTANTGGAWSSITGDLTGVGNIRCVKFVPTLTGGAICVGTQTGVYVAQASNPTAWQRVGTNMPSAYVFDLDYDATDDVLVAGTLGRSAYSIDNASAVITGSAIGEWQAY